MCTIFTAFAFPLLNSIPPFPIALPLNLIYECPLFLYYCYISIKTNLYYPNILGYIAFYWSLVDLPGATLIVKLTLLFLEANKCQ